MTDAAILARARALLRRLGIPDETSVALAHVVLALRNVEHHAKLEQHAELQRLRDLDESNSRMMGRMVLRLVPK